ncbi:hypothetical protein K320107C7_15200 [Alistipes shahii]
MPAQFPVRASFFMRRDGGARRGLFAGRFVYGMVCLRDCLRGEQFAWRSVYGTDSLRLRNLFKDEVRAGTGEPDRETGKQGNRETGKQGNRETGKQGNRETGKQGSGESGAEVRSVSGQWSDRSAAGLQAGCFRGGANGLFCVRRNIYGGFLAPCAITRYIYKSELKKQTDR